MLLCYSCCIFVDVLMLPHKVSSWPKPSSRRSIGFVYTSTITVELELEVYIAPMTSGDNDAKRRSDGCTNDNDYLCEECI